MVGNSERNPISHVSEFWRIHVDCGVAYKLEVVYDRFLWFVARLVAVADSAFWNCVNRFVFLRFVVAPGPFYPGHHPVFVRG